MNTSKKSTGLSYLKVAIIIVLLIFLALFTTKRVKKYVKNEEWEDQKTKILLVEGKAKLIEDDMQIEKEGAQYVGIQFSENLENEYIAKILELSIVQNNEDELKDTYLITKNNINELELQDVELDENSFYIINYKKCDIIYIEDLNNGIYYDISQI